MNKHPAARRIISNNEKNWTWKWKAEPDVHYFVHALRLKNLPERKVRVREWSKNNPTPDEDASPLI